MIEPDLKSFPKPACSQVGRDEFFEKILAESPLGIAFARLDGELLRVNKRLCRMLGFTADELVGKTFADISHPDDPFLSCSLFGNIEKTPDRCCRLEKKFIHKSGTPVWARITATLLCDAQGKPLFLAAQIQDISSRKEFEEEQKITIQILDLINSASCWQDILPGCAAYIKAAFNIDSLAIRLRRDGELASFLAGGIPAGLLVTGPGDPATEKLSSDVLEETFDPEHPSFTRTGSFWVNSRSEMRRCFSDSRPEDRTGRGDLFPSESLALVRLRTANKTYGLLQLSDYLRGRFSRRKIEFLERLTDQVSLDLRRRFAEENADRGGKLFHLIVENANDAIYRFSLAPERKFEYISPAVKRMSGYSPEEIYAYPLIVFNAIHPDSAALLNEVLDNPQNFEEPFRLKWIHKKGHVFWTEHWNSPVYSESGTIIAIEGIARNITAQAEAEDLVLASEAKFRTAFHSHPNPMIVLDIETWKIGEINEAFSNVTGYEKSESLGRTPCELGIVENPDELLLMADEILRHGRPVEKEIEIRVKGGKKEYAVVAAVRINTDDGENALVSAAIITHRKLVDREWRQKQEYLEDKSRSLEEVNTALRVLLRQREEDRADLEENMRSNINLLVLPCIESLKKTGLNGEQKSLLTVLENNVKNLFSPFGRVLNSAAPDLTPRETQVANLIREGWTNKDIGKLLGISPKAVESHRHKIRRKLGISGKKINLHIALSDLEI